MNKRFLAPALLLAIAAALVWYATQTGTHAGQDITPAQAMERIQKAQGADSLVLLDVRTPGEYAAGRIATSILVDYNAPDFRAKLAKLDKDKSYIVYCRTGRRSANAMRTLQSLGFTDFVNLEGGINRWAATGLPIEK